MSDRPRVLFVGRSRYSLPLPGWLAKKWDAVEEQLDYRILGAADAGSPLWSSGFDSPARRGRAASTGSSFTCGCRCGSRTSSESSDPTPWWPPTPSSARPYSPGARWRAAGRR